MNQNRELKDRRNLGARRTRKDRLGHWTALGVVILVGLYLGVLEFSRPHVSGDQLRFDTFVDLVERGRVNDVTFLDQDAYVTGTYVLEEGGVATYNAPLIRNTQGDLLTLLLHGENSPRITIDQQVGKRVAALASILLPGLILVLLFIYLILSYRRGTGLFGIRSGAKRVDIGRATVSFADVAGQDAAVGELKEIQEFLSSPDRFAALGAVVPKGVLLYGPPGCGKTLLARALAGEAGASFFSISGSDFVELYVGVGAARVRDLFKEAREHAPSLIFIDELDSIGRARGTVGNVPSQGEQEQGLNQILAEMDGFSPAEGIIVIGATNRPDILDHALLRPGRFDRTIGLERPDEPSRLAILSLHAANKQLEPSVDLAAIARRAIGMTGADLASVMNESALIAAREGRTAISQPELDRAMHRILDAPERQRRLSLRERSVGKRFAEEEKVTFADVAGADEAVEELGDVREYLAHPETFAQIGARVPRGILLTGPPGCGKTLLARAVAGEANAAFFSTSGSDFVERYVGVGASRVRDLFAEAASVAPAIIFIDEIDGIGGHRSTVSSGGERETEQALNQILVEMDGFLVRNGVIVMAATNRPDLLDSALVRPGRFDRKVVIAVPDRAGRRAILGLHARGKPMASDVELDVLAGLTQGMAGADLANLMNEAALLAARRHFREISMSHIEEAFDRATIGLASRRSFLPQEERRAVAYHEAGHALVARALPGATPPHKLTIVSRGVTLGHCQSLDTHDRISFSRSMLVDLMAVGLAGRIAETIVLGDSRSGSASDLAQVRRLAHQMVCDEAMGEGLGLLAYPQQLGRDGCLRAYSEEAARMIDAEERKLVEEAGQRAHRVLITSRDSLERVVEALLEQETLSATELEILVGAAPIRGAQSGAGRGPQSAATARIGFPS